MSTKAEGRKQTLTGDEGFPNVNDVVGNEHNAAVYEPISVKLEVKELYLVSKDYFNLRYAADVILHVTR